MSWLAIANMLAVFTMATSVDDQGCAIEPTGEFTSGLLWYVSHIPSVECVSQSTNSLPEPFEASFTPRSAELTRMLRADSV